MTEIMMSIRPEWCDKIASGEKTVEVRKSEPKEHWRVLNGLRVYVYCTKAKERLVEILKDGAELYGDTYHGEPVFITTPKYISQYGFPGYVIGEFECTQIEELTEMFYIDEPYRFPDRGNCCLTMEELKKYGGGKRLYAWHIDNFKRYDNKKVLSDFGMKRPPQSWCYLKKTE